MERIIGQIPSWHASAVRRAEIIQLRPGIKTLFPPILVEANHESGGQFLEPNTVPATGATVRVVAYEGMAQGQRIELTWSGKVNYVASLDVVEGGRYLDFIVPRQIVVDNSAAGSIGYCDISYTVMRGGNIEISPLSRIGIVEESAVNPAPIVPQAVNGEFNPNDIPEPGLRIEYELEVNWGAFWISYGRDGRVIASVSFGVVEGERFVYMWRVMLDQTEPGGEVRTNYVARNKDGVFCQSLHAVLHVI
ncbi:hypothetical protein [Pseudomonas caspiana]|uniref:hypothetical protein n=1 Tax=Pseudomonas caspiana TaxID=1451454 RepID=UPI0032EE487D